MSAPWWQPAVIYQIYPRSFQDSTGDGVGDLPGIMARLDHLQLLGVDAVWLSPVYRSPMADYGYDVADYCDVDPLFGTLDDMDRLIAAAHDRGLKVLLDWVPNHTSDEHPWFLESRSSRESEKRDWYVWRDKPNNWVEAFSGEPAWTYDEPTGQYYLHRFLPQQPELNWANHEVVGAMHNVLRFWLDRGVDGFRADVVHLIGKDPALPDDPPEHVGESAVHRHEHPSTHVLLRGIRAVIDSYDDRVLLGEINLRDTARIATYHGQQDELHLAFNFLPIDTPWDASLWHDLIAEVNSIYNAVEAWPTWVLENHDEPRLATRLGNERRARAAAVLLATLRGTMVMYAGQELGLPDAEIPPHRVVDPGGRDGCRAPMPWEAGPQHGWPTEEPWLPWPPRADTRNVAAQRSDEASVLHLYRALIEHRRASPALAVGAQRMLECPPGVVGFERTEGGDRRRTLVNYSADEVQLDLDGTWHVDVDSLRTDEGAAFSGHLRPEQAVLLRG